MKIGILGGGQLGRMLIQNALNYPCEVKVLDPNHDSPCAHYCDQFTLGDFKDEQTVVAFGKDCDVIGIEIEHVSISGIEQLEKMGKRVIPSSKVLTIINDKGLQKQFYKDHHLDTLDFYLISNKQEIDLERIALPFVQKTRKDGYDGKGVQIINSEEDLHKIWDIPSVIEKLCPIKKELAITVLIDQAGSVQLMPIVEMVFNETLNLVDIVKVPANINLTTITAIKTLAINFAKNINQSGLFAIELFLTDDNEILINETACRVHNSGHLTIEACECSQFDQMWRIFMGQSLGNSESRTHAAMINLIGAPNQAGPALLKHMPEILKQEGVFLHWYGKQKTLPGRKMGHLTITAPDAQQLDKKIKDIQFLTEVISSE